MKIYITETGKINNNLKNQKQTAHVYKQKHESCQQIKMSKGM